MVLTENLLGMSREFFSLWGYLIVFVALFLESFPFLGAFIPGGIITLLLSGFLAKLGFFLLWKIVLVAIVAAILIDIFGYLFGRFVSKDFFHRHARILLVKRKTLEKVGRIVRGHTGKSLIIGRMNPVTRSIAPFIVGNERVSFAKFFFYDVVGGILWVTTFVFIGYMFGNSYQFVQNTERYILWATVILLGGFYVYYMGNIFKEFFSKKNGVENGANCKK